MKIILPLLHFIFNITYLQNSLYKVCNCTVEFVTLISGVFKRQTLDRAKKVLNKIEAIVIPMMDPLLPLFVCLFIAGGGCPTSCHPLFGLWLNFGVAIWSSWIIFPLGLFKIILWWVWGVQPELGKNPFRK